MKYKTLLKRSCHTSNILAASNCDKRVDFNYNLDDAEAFVLWIANRLEKLFKLRDDRNKERKKIVRWPKQIAFSHKRKRFPSMKQFSPETDSLHLKLISIYI